MCVQNKKSPVPLLILYCNARGYARNASIPAAQICCFFKEIPLKKVQFCAAGIYEKYQQNQHQFLTRRSKKGILHGSDVQCVVYVEFSTARRLWFGRMLQAVNPPEHGAICSGVSSCKALRALGVTHA
jgi:hypothetical protein